MGNRNDLVTIKAKIIDLDSTFNSLETDDIDRVEIMSINKEIMSQKKSKELSNFIGPVLKQYKLELQ